MSSLCSLRSSSLRLLMLFLLLSLPGTRVFAQRELPVTAALDLISTPTLGGQGRALWCALTEAPLGAVTLTFTLESPAAARLAASPQCHSLYLIAGQAREAEFAFATPVAGRYRILARLEWSDAQGTLSATDSLALEVAPDGTVRRLPDVITLAVGARTPANGGTTLRLDNDCSGHPSACRVASSPDFVGAPWHPYAPAVAYTAPLGTPTVYFIVRDASGNVSAPVALALAKPFQSAPPAASPKVLKISAPAPALRIPAGAGTASPVRASSQAPVSPIAAKSVNALAIADPKILWPTAANTFALGNQQMTISWSGLTSSRVRVELYRGDTLNRLLAEEAPNTGWFMWSLAPGQKLGGNFSVRISPADDPVQAIASANPFWIENPKVSYPTKSGITLKRGSTLKVKWKGFDQAYEPRVKIDLFKAGTLVATLNAATANDGSTSVQLPGSLAAGTDYKIRILSVAHPAVNDWSDYNFAVTK